MSIVHQVEQADTIQGEQSLLHALRIGENAAAAELYRRHHAQALGYALHEVGDEHHAQEIVSEAFTSTLSAIRSGRGPVDNFALYLRTAIRHLVWRVARDKRRISFVGDIEAYILEHDHVPDHARLMSDIEDEVAAAFKLLPGRYQHVLELRVMHELTNKQSAVRLGLTPDAAAHLYKRARTTFKRLLLAAAA